MPKISIPLLTAVLWLLGIGSPLADAPPLPAPPTLDAKSHILVDFFSGRILAENNADERLEPASLTKLMTAYLVFKELKAGHVKLEDEATVSEKAWRTGGSRTFIEVGKRVRLEDLLKGMIIQSGNDASVALAEHIAGDEATFANMMNQEAEALGMTNTHYVNSMGMPNEAHYSSARDIATLAVALIRNFPDYYAWYSQREFTYNGITQHNRNRLLWQGEGVDGIKTGYTEAAGYCLATSAQREGMRLVSVVMGTKSPRARTDITQALLNYGFRFYETQRLYAAAEPLTKARIWKGGSVELDLGLAQDLYVTIPRGQTKELNAALELEPIIVAPVTRGQPVGRVEVKLDDAVIAEQPLVSLADVPEGGLWRQLVDSAMLLFQ
jgi:D-alanyl-D-alanine carboxypeptidase (penicillin-binding protein 5/6)